MSSEGVCRICLSVDVRLLSLIPLQDVYERVTNYRLHTDKRPVTACYICVAEMQRCHRFLTKCIQAETTMEELLTVRSNITPKSLAVVDRKERGLCHSFAVTPVKHEVFESDFLVLVKLEPLEEEDVNVKEEGDPLTEDMAVSEPEDNSDDEDIPLGSIEQEKIRVEPGSSQSTEATSDNDQPALPLEVNIKIEENDSDDDAKKRNEQFDEARREEGMQSGPEKQPEKQHTEYNPNTNLGLLKIRPVKGYECTVCQRRFNQNKVLKNHLRIHTGEKPYSCSFCDSKFAQYSSLTRHTMSHTGKKSHTCNICERGFTQSGELKKHLRTHTGEKPYTCEICKKSFSLNKHLKSHIKVHTGEKPYECDICKTKFREITHMKRHRSTHTDEKPFECGECGNKFNRRCNLINHLRIHSGIKDFKCQMCDAKFYRTTHLRAHMLSHDKDKKVLVSCEENTCEKQNV